MGVSRYFRGEVLSSGEGLYNPMRDLRVCTEGIRPIIIIILIESTI